MVKNMFNTKIIETKIISVDNNSYEGWPTVSKLNNGNLCLVFSGGRKRHVCPFGRLEFMLSNDNGKSWSWPRVIFDSAFDDRDGGILVTQKGTLIATTFSSDAYVNILNKANELQQQNKLNWPDNELLQWQQAHQRTLQTPDSTTGQWVFRSIDNGATWSDAIPSHVNSPHGPINLKSGKLLYAGKELWHGKARLGFCISDDDGLSWKWQSELPTRPGDSSEHYHELHAVEMDNETIIVQIRNWNENNQGETLQSESLDGGNTWTIPHSIGVWGLPSHLLKLSDGRLMMTYGHRRKPFGNQARISNDSGQTWSEPLFISTDGTCGDLGYPSTVEISKNHFITIWYERKEHEKRAILRQAEWNLFY